MKKLLAAVFLCLASTTHAQIIPFALGMAVSSGSSKGPSDAGVVLTSQDPSRDVILCQRSISHEVSKECEAGWGDYVSATEYAKRMGYAKVHRKGVVVQGRQTFVVMEVSK